MKKVGLYLIDWGDIFVEVARPLIMGIGVFWLRVDWNVDC